MNWVAQEIVFKISWIPKMPLCVGVNRQKAEFPHSAPILFRLIVVLMVRNGHLKNVASFSGCNQVPSYSQVKTLNS